MSRRDRRSVPFSTIPYLSSFQTSDDRCFYLPSGCVEHGMATPLSAAYMHGASASRDIPQYLAVGDEEGRVHVLDTQAPSTSQDHAILSTSPAIVNGSVFAMAWRPDDRVIALGGSDYTVSLWDLQHEICVRAYDAHQGSPRALAWDPFSDGTIVTSGGRDGSIYVWDLRMAEAALHLPRAHGPRRRSRRQAEAHTAGVTALAYVPNGQLVSACSDHAMVHAWDLRATNRVVSTSADASCERPWNKRSHGISSLAVSASRHRVYAACTDGCINILDADDVHRPLPTWEASAMYMDVQRQNTLYARLAMHDDRFLALGCNSGDVVLWDVAHLPRNPDTGLAYTGVCLPRAHDYKYVRTRSNIAVRKSML
ncbi:proteasome-mediated ubiquitin-dependent protein catabolic protein [Malassezia pachydermatis]